ncbi:hypothetical protein ACTHOQ_13950 [Solibacillus silvestris]|uniref:hypothetical protein n=1 Tax=Solibacillus silvestris TaxID=76853 RepID=UPI003F7ED2DA
MLKRFFHNLIQTKPSVPKKNYEDVISDFYYGRIVKDLVDSKYCEINSDEEDFIKHLLYKLHQNNQVKLVKLRRMSNKSIEFSYNTYPIGKFKLQGKKTWMQILTSLEDQKKLENNPLHEYIEAVDLWIAYIKKYKLNR